MRRLSHTRRLGFVAVVAALTVAAGPAGFAEDPPAPAPASAPPAGQPAKAEAEFLAHLQAGREHLQARANTFRAAAEFAMAVKADPTRPEGWSDLGLATLKSGDPSGAMLFLVTALARGAGAEADLRLAQAAERLGRLPAAFLSASSARARFAAAKDAVGEKEATAAAARLAGLRPGLAAEAAAFAKAHGPVTEILARYVASAAGDANRREGGSVGVGVALDLRCLAWAGFSKEGLAVSFAPAWSVSPGLVLRGTNPVDIAAGASAALRESIRIEDAAAKVTGSAIVNVVGPIARLDLSRSAEAAPPGHRIHLAVRVSDAAGNRLGADKLVWSAGRVDGTPAPEGALRRKESHGIPAHFFEPHRNIFYLPDTAQDADLGDWQLTVATPDGSVRAMVVVRITRDAAVAASGRATGIAWVDNYEEGLEAARVAGRPLFVEFTADW